MLDEPDHSDEVELVVEREWQVSEEHPRFLFCFFLFCFFFKLLNGKNRSVFSRWKKRGERIPLRGTPSVRLFKSRILVFILFFSFFNTSFFFNSTLALHKSRFYLSPFTKDNRVQCRLCVRKKRIFCRGTCASKRWSPSFFNKNKNKKHSCMCDLKRIHAPIIFFDVLFRERKECALN